jgi:hypothetical protein
MFRATRWLLAPSVLFLPVPVFAADITDVVDAADEDDPFDMHIEPTFRQTRRSALIQREYPCDPSATAGEKDRFRRLDDDCAEPTVVFRKEMEAEHVTNQLDVDVQIGLYKDVELHLTLPYIISEERALKFAGGDDGEVTDGGNSFVDPLDTRIRDDIESNVPDPFPSDILARQYYQTYRLFTLNEQVGPTRSGFGDMNVGLAWNPFNDQRDETKATLRLAFDYQIPTGDIAKARNEGVGRGLHEFKWTVASSKRFRYLEPYFSVSYILPVPAEGSLFEKKGPGQTLTSPGQRAELVFGSEFIPYENLEKGQKFVIDIGLNWGFTAEGRDYGYLFDALGNSACNGLTPGQIEDAIEAVRTGQNTGREQVNRAACRWVLEQPANADGSTVFDPSNDDVADVPFSHDGITDYESYATFGAALGLHFQPSEYVQIRGRLGVEHEQEHFITAARTGIASEADGNDTVRFDDPNERNPYYNPTLDGVGNRFRAENSLIFSWSLALALQF